MSLTLGLCVSAALGLGCTAPDSAADMAAPDQRLAVDLAIDLAADSAAPDLSLDLASPDLQGGLGSCGDGQRNGFETDTDCGGGVCWACAGGRRCRFGQDCLTGVCQGGICAAACDDAAQDGAETDVDCGGGACPACADGKGCAAARDCGSGVCRGGRCQAPTCADGVKNGAETDTDCGGGACAACAVGKGCAAARDCGSGVCVAGACGPATCLDRVKDNGESDVDCGGPCVGCAAGLVCGAAADCADGVCRASRCVAGTCSDGVRNAGESDIDCGGPCAACPAGRRCGAVSDCAAGLLCGGGVCAVPASCQALKAGRAAADGVYVIDPDGAGPQAPLSAYCDMTADGGGWMLVTPAMLTGESNANCTVVQSADARGGAALQVYANAPGCGAPLSSSHAIQIAAPIPWTQVRAAHTFVGASSCWSVFGDARYLAGAELGVYPYDAAQDGIRGQVRMGGAAGDAFDGVTSRCDNTTGNFWHSTNGTAARSAVVVLRRKAGKPAGLGVGTSCASVASGATSPTWWRLAEIYVR